MVESVDEIELIESQRQRTSAAHECPVGANQQTRITGHEDVEHPADPDCTAPLDEGIHRFVEMHDQTGRDESIERLVGEWDLSRIELREVAACPIRQLRPIQWFPAGQSGRGSDVRSDVPPKRMGRPGYVAEVACAEFKHRVVVRSGARVLEVALEPVVGEPTCAATVDLAVEVRVVVLDDVNGRCFPRHPGLWG